MAEDIIRLCRGCGSTFTISAGEQRWWHQFGSRTGRPWHWPTACESCRAARRRAQYGTDPPPPAVPTGSDQALTCIGCGCAFAFSARAGGVFGAPLGRPTSVRWLSRRAPGAVGERGVIAMIMPRNMLTILERFLADGLSGSIEFVIEAGVVSTQKQLSAILPGAGAPAPANTERGFTEPPNGEALQHVASALHVSAPQSAALAGDTGLPYP
jgi:hypothetical protein